MIERLLRLDNEPLSPINAGEVIRRTPNFQIVTDYKHCPENTRNGERFFIEPTSPGGLSMLLYAASAHNIYNFNHRLVFGARSGVKDIIPCLRADYIKQNVWVLLRDDVQIPQPGEDTVPSPGRMEACIAKGARQYTFNDELPANFGITNPHTRHLRMLQMTYKDEIPDRIVHSPNPDSYYKVRKNWWYGVELTIDIGIERGEFTNPKLVEEMQRFLAKYFNTEFGNPNTLTTAEDIQVANELISRTWEIYGNKLS